MALAYFITFSTYGTWLHGSEKRSVDRSHNAYGAEFLPPNADQEQAEGAAMLQAAYVMGPRERDIVRDALVGLAKERGWDLLALHVRSNHVHLVVAAERDPGRMMSDMKARASRELTRAGFGDAERRRWSRHGSTRHLFRIADVEAAIRYSLDEQGERMAWYAKEPRTQ
ncbi:MAG: transposase [Gemmataceae bacterium]|nr:transposase [Gemmataceae bacterium]